MPTHSLTEREKWRLTEGAEAKALAGATSGVERCEKRLANAKKNLASATVAFEAVVADVAELKTGSRDGGSVNYDVNGFVESLSTP